MIPKRGQGFIRCTKCLRQTLRRPHMQAELAKLAELDPEIASIAILYLEKGMSYKEVGVKLGMGEAVARRKIEYAIQFLRGGCVQDELFRHSEAA